MTAPRLEAARDLPAPALFRVVRGRPTPEELAAAASVLIASARRRPAGPVAANRGSGSAGWLRTTPEDVPPQSWASLSVRHLALDVRHTGK